MDISKFGWVLLFIFLGTVFLKGQSNLLDTEVDFKIRNTTIVDALLALSEQSGVSISFDSSIFPENKRISIRENASLETIIEKCLYGYNVEYELGDGSVLLKAKMLSRYTLSGYIEDAESGERLIGAYLVNEDTGNGVTSNEYGFFSLDLFEGKKNISISYIGYEILNPALDLQKDEDVVYGIKPENTLQEIVVEAKPIYFKKKESVHSRLSKTYLKEAEQTHASSLAGEDDVLQHCYLLPGVESGADGFGGMHVRGGEVDQNLILMDGVPIFNPSHTLGLVSVFNSSAVKHVVLEKGGFSAQHGGRLSSVLDIRTNEGNVNRFAGSIEIGTVAARATLEGPFKKGRAGFFVSYRRTFWDPLIKLGYRISRQNNGREGDGNYNFFDFNAKVHWGLGKKNKFYLSMYSGEDNYYESDSLYIQQDSTILFDNDTSIYILDSTTIQREKKEREIQWGNFIWSFRWNREYNSKLFSNTTLTYSRFDYGSRFLDDKYLAYFGKDTIEGYNAYLYTFGTEVRESSIRTDFDYLHSPEHSFKMGGGVRLRSFNPGFVYAEDKVGESLDSLISEVEENRNKGGHFNTYELFFYGQDRMKFNKWDIVAGLHYSHFYTRNKQYISLQPRINVDYVFSEKWNINVSLTHMSQYIHLLTSFGAGFPNDLWFPSSEEIKPQTAWQFSMGHDWKLSENFLIETETYYKKMKNLVAYKSAANFPQLTDIQINGWEDELTFGKGYAWGWETKVRMSFKPIDFTASYTLSKSERHFDDLNEGVPFPFSFDNRHSFKTTLFLKMGKKTNLSASYIYNSGRPITLVKTSGTPLFFSNEDQEIEYLSTINGHRLMPYSRLNVGFDFNFRKKWGGQVFSIGVYNATNNSNEVFRYVEEDFDDPNTSQLKTTTLLPFFPSFRYELYIK